MLSRTRGRFAARTVTVVATALAVLGLLAAPSASARTDHLPTGTVGSFHRSGYGVVMTGTAVDPDTTAAAVVYLRVDDVRVARTTANLPGHGFTLRAALPAGTHEVCARIPDASNYARVVTLPCRTITLNYDPAGAITSLTQTPGTLTASGWAVDWDVPWLTAQVAILLDGHSVAGGTADGSNSAFTTKYPKSGDHGFSISFPVTEGVHRVCLKAYNLGKQGADSTPACITQTVDFSPTGAITAMSQIPGGVHVAGWAQDPDTTASTVVTLISSNTALGQLTANGADKTHPGHGFAADLKFPWPALKAGPRGVCLRIRNLGQYGHTRTVQCLNKTFNWNPTGAIESVRQSGAGALVSGWAADPDTSAPVTVRLSADGVRAARITANGTRGSHPGHMFSTLLKLSNGAHAVCAIAQNTLYGSADSTPSCSKVTLNFDPFGGFESAARANGSSGITVTGWAIDPETTAPITVQVAIGRTVTTATANVVRTDVAKAHPGTGSAHGFAVTIPEPSTDGEHRVCVSAVNVGGGAKPTVGLGCKLVIAVHPVAPAAPTGVTAVGGYGGAQITWKAPTSDGGAPWTSYTVRALPGGPSTTVAAGVQSATVYGLKPSTTYTFAVSARNVAGMSSAGVSPQIKTQKQPPPQTTPAPISTSRYIRNVHGSSSSDLAMMRREGAADATANPSGHGYLVLLDIGGQDESRRGVILTAGVRFVTYTDMVKCIQAYVDGYASKQRVSAPMTLAIATNNDIDVYRASGVNFANKIIDPIQSYARRYPGITIAGSDDMEPGFRASYAQTKAWLQGYLSASTAPFVFTGSADGCAWSYSGGSCNNGWTMAGLYYLAAGAYPVRMFSLPQVYNNTMAQQWRYISLTGVQTRQPRINFGGALTEWTACRQAQSCGSLTGRSAWTAMWNALRAEPSLRPSTLPYSTDLRIDS